MTVVILGGGVGGLSAAYYVQKLTGHKIVLLEASQRLGGWIRSHRLPNGLILEQGPRTLRPRGEAGLNTLGLVDELGLSPQVRPIRSDHPAARNRYVYVKGALHALPTGARALFARRAPFSRPLIAAVLHELRAPAKYVDDESIYSFVERRFGRELAEYAVSPLICGICGGDAKRISVNFLLRDWFEREQRYGSVLKSMARPWSWPAAAARKGAERGETARRAVAEKWSSYSMAGGLEALPRALERRVRENGAVVRPDCAPLSIDFAKRAIRSADGEIPFDFVVSAVPAPTLAQLVRDDHYYHLSRRLLEIEYTSIVVVNLVYHRPVLKMQGFGFLTPPSENLPILGTIFDSCYAPFEDWTVLTVMMGGHCFDKYFSQDCTEETLARIASENVRKILGVDCEPDMRRVAVLRDCIPQHTVCHANRVKKICTYIKQEELPLFLVGNAYAGTGINDVIMAARNAAGQILDFGKKEEMQRFTVDYL